MVRHKAGRGQHTISVSSGIPPQGALSSPEGSLAWLGWPPPQGKGQLGLQRAGVPVEDREVVTAVSGQPVSRPCSLEESCDSEALQRGALSSSFVEAYSGHWVSSQVAGGAHFSRAQRGCQEVPGKGKLVRSAPANTVNSPSSPDPLLRTWYFF